MKHNTIKGKDIELDINIRIFSKVREEEIIEKVKDVLSKYYNGFEINLDLPEKVTTSTDEIKMDNEKDGSISTILVDAKYKVREKFEHEEMQNIIERIVMDLDDELRDMGILFKMWSCSSVE